LDFDLFFLLSMASSTFDDHAKQNWISVLYSFACLAEGIKPYTRDQFAKLHAKFQGLTRHIQKACSSAIPCSCKRYLQDWCQICKEWRTNIIECHVQECYGSDWSKVDSSKWLSDSLEIENVSILIGAVKELLRPMMVIFL
jgi:hypothetical protein